VQPLPFLFSKMAEDRLASGWSAEVDIARLPSHGVEKAKLGIGRAQRRQFDAGAMRAEAANDPASAQLYEGIGAADRAVNDGLVENFSWAFVLQRTIFAGIAFSSTILLSVGTLSPMGGRWNQGFRFAGDAATVPVGDGDVAGVAEAAKSGGAMGQAEFYSRCGH